MSSLAGAKSGDETPRKERESTQATREERDPTQAVPRRGTAVPRDDKADPIGRALRQLYDGMAGEPIPEDLLKLIDRLDASDGKQP